MKTRRFGRTGLAVPELVMGGGWVGGILINSDEEVRHRAVRVALDAGIDWIDTAADYGQGQSEETIGRILAALPENGRPRISTKVRLDLDGDADFERQIRESIETSLKRLGLSKVPLFQLHNPVMPKRDGGKVAVDEVLKSGGIADLLDKVRADGLCDHVGFTAVGDTACCIQVIESGRMDTAQVYYNLINPSAGLADLGGLKVQSFCGLLDACARHDVGVMNIRVYAAGVLCTDDRHGREIPITTESDMAVEAARAHAVLDALGEDEGSRAQRAIRFSLADERVSCVVVGLAELDHLEEAITGQAMGPLSADALARVKAVWDDNFGL